MKLHIFTFWLLTFFPLLISLPKSYAHDISQVKDKKFGMFSSIEWNDNQDGKGSDPNFDSSEFVVFWGDQLGDKFAFLIESELELGGDDFKIGGEVLNFSLGKAYGLYSILEDKLNISVGIIPVNFGPLVDLHHDYYNNLIGTGVMWEGPYSEEENLDNFYSDGGIALSGLLGNFYYEGGYVNGFARDIIEEEEIKPRGFYVRGEYTITPQLTAGMSVYNAHVSNRPEDSSVIDREEFYLVDIDYQSQGYWFTGAFMVVRNKETDGSSNRGILASLEGHIDLTKEIFISARAGIIKPFKEDTIFGVSDAGGGLGGALQGEFGMGYQLSQNLIIKVSYQRNWEESNPINNDSFFLQINFVL